LNEIINKSLELEVLKSNFEELNCMPANEISLEEVEQAI
jgi:hypothetical protein